MRFLKAFLNSVLVFILVFIFHVLLLSIVFGILSNMHKIRDFVTELFRQLRVKRK